MSQTNLIWGLRNLGSYILKKMHSLPLSLDAFKNSYVMFYYSPLN
jgi:hypothetical protein